MVRFAHLADVHLGGWKQQPLQQLNFQSFQKAIQNCIEKKVEFVLIAGDLFDTAYPSIEVLKETFAEFKKLKEAKIPCFIIAGSHDYSVSGKTFLDVLEKAGFCKNVYDVDEKNSEEIQVTGEQENKEDQAIHLNPTLHQGIAIYGYPGKKSSLEIKDIRKIKLNDAPGNIRKKVNKRKQEYVIMTRKLRRYTADLKKKEELSREEVIEIRKRIRNRQFKSKANLKQYIAGLKK